MSFLHVDMSSIKIVKSKHTRQRLITFFKKSFCCVCFGTDCMNDLYNSSAWCISCIYEEWMYIVILMIFIFSMHHVDESTMNICMCIWSTWYEFMCIQTSVNVWFGVLLLSQDSVCVTDMLPSHSPMHVLKLWWEHVSMQVFAWTWRINKYNALTPTSKAAYSHWRAILEDSRLRQIPKHVYCRVQGCGACLVSPAWLLFLIRKVGQRYLEGMCHLVQTLCIESCSCLQQFTRAQWM
jgi:hypothetical protein